MILLMNSGNMIYSDGASMALIADVLVLEQVNCRRWSEVASLLQTPLVWNEDSAPDCNARGGDYSES